MKFLKSKLFKVLLLIFVVLVGLGVALYMFLMPVDKPVQQSNNGPRDGVETVIPGYENGVPEEADNVDFNLSKPDGSDFSDIDDNNTDNTDNTLYTFEDGYAYALDPTTLEKVGPALNPVTKEPIESEDVENNTNTNLIEQESKGYNISNNNIENNEQQNTDGENNEQQNTDDENNEHQNDNSESNINIQEQDENKQVTEESSKLPNTGIFLEDD